MKLWIDDVRPTPEGYIWCKSVNEALRTIHKYPDEITEISLDHDSGDYVTEGGDFINVLNELERLCNSKSLFQSVRWLERCEDKYSFVLHSANPVGVANMRAIIEKNGWKEIRQ